MKPNNGLRAMRALGGRIAAVLLGVVCAVCVSATPALAVEASITNTRTSKSYSDLASATAERRVVTPSSSARVTTPSTV